MTTTITVDYERNCETWWDAAREEAKGNPPTACVGLLDSVSTLTVSDEDAAEFVSWAKKLPGWKEQPFVIFKAKTLREFLDDNCGDWDGRYKLCDGPSGRTIEDCSPEDYELLSVFTADDGTNFAVCKHNVSLDWFVVDLVDGPRVYDLDHPDEIRQWVRDHYPMSLNESEVSEL